MSRIHRQHKGGRMKCDGREQTGCLTISSDTAQVMQWCGDVIDVDKWWSGMVMVTELVVTVTAVATG
jgi:hypothetical protein